MKINYDEEVDILVITLSENKIIDSDEEKPGMVFDYDKNGDVVSIEIFGASERVINPAKVEMEHRQVRHRAGKTTTIIKKSHC